jgi:hypothetical protein
MCRAVFRGFLSVAVKQGKQEEAQSAMSAAAFGRDEAGILLSGQPSGAASECVNNFETG